MISRTAIENTFLLEKEESEQIPACESGLEPHTWQINDFSDSQGGEVYLSCELCGKKKRN